jgi:uncharacterized SAM-binding protein YcdF (DUF218 family)
MSTAGTLGKGVILLGAAWLGGLGWFWLTLPQPLSASVRTDGVVALTGGEGRLAKAIDVLQRAKAQRLLISGAHKDAGPRSLARELGAPLKLFRCCVDIGHAAGDTIGNATEVAAWVDRHGFKSVRLVTSDYHMPRSLLEVRSRLEGVTVIADPVPAPDHGWRTIVAEYSKFLMRLVWLRAQGR